VTQRESRIFHEVIYHGSPKSQFVRTKCVTHVIIHMHHRVVYMKTRRVIENRNSYLFVYYESIKES
jgi:hypothetical protein